MKRTAALLLVLLGGGCGGSAAGPSCPDCQSPEPAPDGGAHGSVSPVLAENALPGDPDWRSGRDAYAQQIEVYLDRVSVPAGATVQMMVSADSTRRASWKLYRFGWYGGAQARQVAAGDSFPVARQAACPMEPSTGLVRCAWTPSASVTVPADSISGLYAVKVIRDDGFAWFAPLVVVDDRKAALLLQASVDTYQAYNAWGGESLYRDDSHTFPLEKAVQVSFDRPYAANAGLSDMGHNEVPFAWFLERNGYDVSYTSNLDVARGGVAHLTRTGAFLSVGHDEYWAGEEREAVEAARDAGVPLLFFGANAAYWKVRYQEANGAGEPRVITCYKGRTRDDPAQGAEVTGRFRDPPIDRPENALVGAMYGSYQVDTFPWVAGDAQSWLLDGTGLKRGESIPLLVGNEYDRTFDNGQEPADLEILARSPVVDAHGIHDVSETVAYRAASGALVFDAGTIFWSHGLDPRLPAHDARVERMTANVLARATGLPVPALSAPASLHTPAAPANRP